MRPPYLLILLLLPLLAFGQTKTVTKTISTNALTESFVVPSGASVTISPGASIINQGTATGFDASGSIPWANITSKPTTLSGFGITDGITAAAVAAGYQPLDGDLTSIAALTTNSFGRGLLTFDSAAAVRSALGLGSLATQSANLSDYLTAASAATTYQPLDADLTSIAALTTDSFGRSLLTQTSASATRALLGLGTLATQSGTISDYLTTSGAASAYQPLDADLTSLAALSTAAFGRSLLTQVSAVATRRAVAASVEVAGTQQITELSVNSVSSGAYIEIPYASEVLRLWWNVDGTGGSPGTPAAGVLVEVGVSSSGSTADWANTLYGAISSYTSSTGLAVNYFGGGTVVVTQPLDTLAPVDTSAATGTVTATITTPGALGYDKLPPLRADDVVLLNQVIGALAYFDGSIWQALPPSPGSSFLKLTSGGAPTLTAIKGALSDQLLSDVSTTSASLSNVMTLSALEAGTTYLILAMGPHSTSVNTEGTYFSLNGTGTINGVFFFSVNYTALNTVNGVSYATAFNGYQTGTLSGPGTTARPFFLAGVVHTTSAGSLSLRFATETAGQTSTVKAGTNFIAIPLYTP